MGVAEAYAMATDRFPRAACFWKKLLQLHLQNEDMQACEDGFRNCLQKCRNVDLWNLYLSFMSKKTVEKEVRCSENYANAERAMEAAFEEALDSVGMASDSHVLWRRYLDFILEWPEQGMRDSGMKVSALRAVYQRAVCTAMEDLD
ncbi:su(f), partial [Symbiodinium microadriaticum]